LKGVSHFYIFVIVLK